MSLLLAVAVVVVEEVVNVLADVVDGVARRDPSSARVTAKPFCKTGEEVLL